MKILVVAATKEEVSYLFDKYGIQIAADKHLYKHELFDLLITGIGMVNTTYYLTKTVLTKKYDLTINLGIAGSFKEHIKIGDVVEVTTEQFGDLGAEDNDNFLDSFELNLQNKSQYPFIGGVLKVQASNLHLSLDDIQKANSISVNKAHGNLRSIQLISKKYNPDIENMEGAAFFYCCLKENVPFIEIRAISNYVEPRNKENWDIPLAIKHLNTTAINILNQLNK